MATLVFQTRDGVSDTFVISYSPSLNQDYKFKFCVYNLHQVRLHDFGVSQNQVTVTRALPTGANYLMKSVKMP